MAGFQDVFGTLTARTQRIVNFNSFILSHVPYGRVDPDKDIQIGLIEYDGPQADLTLFTKPLLAWHFGGIAHPITKAARVEYTYRYGDTGGPPVKASILLGFQTKLDQTMLKRSPQIKPPDSAGQAATLLDLSNGVAVSAQTTNVVTGSALGFDTLDAIIDGELLTEFTAVAAAQAKAGLAAGRAADLLTAANDAKQAVVEAKRPPDTTEVMTSESVPEATPRAVDTKKLEEDAANAEKNAKAATTKAKTEIKAIDEATTASDLAVRAWTEQKKIPVVVHFDGPAQDNNSLNPFNYTPQTLFNDKEKYAQVLWWYFGGRAYRVTKALRIPIPIRTAQYSGPTAPEDVESLFIGFAGPGGDSTA
jgi:hypothetical protein